MTTVSTGFIKGLLAVAFVFIAGVSFSATAQDAVLKSRVAVIASEAKTNIWVSDFPKKTSVVITDSDNNLLSIVSTNDFGAAFISLSKNIKTTVIVKTLDEEIIVSNKAVLKNKSEEQNVVLNANHEVNKA